MFRSALKQQNCLGKIRTQLKLVCSTKKVNMQRAEKTHCQTFTFLQFLSLPFYFILKRQIASAKSTGGRHKLPVVT